MERLEAKQFVPLTQEQIATLVQGKLEGAIQQGFVL
jgi:hypothetical protein